MILSRILLAKGALIAAAITALVATESRADSLAQIEQRSPVVAEALARVKAVSGVYFTDDNLQIKIADLGASSPSGIDCSATHRWGVYTKTSAIRGTIELDKTLTAVTRDSRFAQACDGVANPWEFAVSVTVHELGHFLAETMVTKNPNFYAPWRELGIFADDKSASANRNAAFSESPYQYADVREFVAVAFEGYVLDPLYACTHAAQTLLFNRIFGAEFRSVGASCRASMLPVEVDGKMKWVPLRSSSVGKIEYRIDGDHVKLRLYDLATQAAIQLDWSPRAARDGVVSGLSLDAIPGEDANFVAIPPQSFAEFVSFLWESAWRQKVSVGDKALAISQRDEFLKNLGGLSALQSGLSPPLASAPWGQPTPRWLEAADFEGLDAGNLRYRGIPLLLETN